MQIENPENRILIDGNLTEAENDRTYDNINPATEEIIGVAADASANDAERAIATARRAFDETRWSTDLAFRRKCLDQLHAALLEEKESLRAQVIAEAGAPLALTYAVQLDTALEDMRYDIEVSEKIAWEENLPDHDFFGMRSRRTVYREPIGVVAAITPWNYPFMLNTAKITPGLMAGNAVILKAAPETPWSATFLGRLVAEKTDIPPGVFSVLTASDPAEVGDILTADPRVDMISFTGSTAVGKHISARAGQTVKRVLLELGGKSANIILDDANIGHAASGAVMQVCSHAGQGCALATRLLLPHSLYDEGVEAVANALRAMKYGDPTDMANIMGPLVSVRQRGRVLQCIEQAKADGARLVCGGGQPSHLKKGYFVEPTLFADVDPDSALAQEEVFGPVLAVIPFDDDDHAVRIANNSRYGLSGAVTSGSIERATAVARRIRTGTLSVNGGMWFGPDTPFGGYRQSGNGREHGVAGFLEYLETKTIGFPA
jgi:aldehyde dehydrogenase (NAD+)